jgi:hypothetical protein
VSDSNTLVSDARPVPGAGSGVLNAILWGGLTAGVLDILAAFLTLGIRGVSPIRVLQGIASGLVGRASFQGGLPTAALGLLLHFFIATTAAAVYVGASTKLPALVQRPFLFGPLYGVAVYFFMNYIVLPLSLAGRGTFTLRAFITGIVVHIFCVGLPIAYFARRGLRRR